MTTLSSVFLLTYYTIKKQAPVGACLRLSKKNAPQSEYKKLMLIGKKYHIITNEHFYFCSFCHKCQKPLFYTLCLSSCISIRTRFGCVFFRHCIVKILANASAFTAFLPRIVAKTQHRKFFEPKII